MTERIALDLRRYSDSAKLSSLASDTASLAIEASEDRLPRVNPHFYIKRGENYVIAPGRDKRDVRKMFAVEDKATEAAEKIINHLLTEKVNSAYIWISAPNGTSEPETRIEIGAKKSTKSGKYEYLKCYGISTRLKDSDCLLLGQLLVSLSSHQTEYPQSSEELRKVILKVEIPEGADPYEYLSELINLPEKNVWESILNGQADKNKAAALKAAVVATQPIMSNPHVIYSNPIGYGAYVENQMAHLGFEMNPKKFGCGISNNDTGSTRNLTPAPEYYSTTITLSESTFNCPRCLRPIQSGRGIETCPHCGLTKDEAGSLCV